MNRAKKKNPQAVLTPQDAVNNYVQKAAEAQAPEQVSPEAVAEAIPPQEAVKPACAQCRWSSPAKTESNVDVSPSAFGMICRFGPPVYVGLSYTAQTKIRSLSQFAFPRVREDDWCGQFEPKG